MALADDVKRCHALMKQHHNAWRQWASTPEGRAALDAAWDSWQQQEAAGVPVENRSVPLFRRVN